MICPKCKSKKLISIKGRYNGCITDNNRYGQSMACGINHEGKKCKDCKFMFFYGDEFEVFSE